MSIEAVKVEEDWKHVKVVILGAGTRQLLPTMGVPDSQRDHDGETPSIEHND